MWLPCCSFSPSSSSFFIRHKLLHCIYLLSHSCYAFMLMFLVSHCRHPKSLIVVLYRCTY
jgi:hypothetical protein